MTYYTILSIVREYLLIGMGFCAIQMLGILLRKDKNFLQWTVFGMILVYFVVSLTTWNIKPQPGGLRTYVLTHLSCLDAPFMYGVGPLAYMLIRESKAPVETNRKKYLLHWIPALLVLLISIPYYLLPLEIKALKPTSGNDNLHFTIMNYTFLLGLFHACAYYIYFAIKVFPIWSYEQKHKSDPVAFLITSVFFISFGLAGILYLLRYFLNEPLFYYLCTALYSSCVIAEYLLGSRTSNFTMSFETIMKESNLREKKSLIQGLDLSSVSERLKNLMEQEKVYQNRELTIDELARLSNLGRNQLSEYLNKELNKNFSVYINEYRIQEARRLLEETPDASISNIGHHVGFTNLSTFNRYFAKITGHTPRQYRKLHSRS